MGTRCVTGAQSGSHVGAWLTRKASRPAQQAALTGPAAWATLSQPRTVRNRRASSRPAAGRATNATPAA